MRQQKCDPPETFQEYYFLYEFSVLDPSASWLGSAGGGGAVTGEKSRFGFKEGAEDPRSLSLQWPRGDSSASHSGGKLFIDL